MTKNRLHQTTSPYLLQHAGNPVHWQPWDAEALALARQQKKPILLSSGYSACHWCHVMARESFEDPETAEVMNRHFINIKVDREERPDIDNIYQSALAKMGQARGWPLTMFLTPEGEPFAGGTYYPPTPRYDRPAFRDLLETMARSYAEDPEKAAATAARLISDLRAAKQGQSGGEISLALRNHVANQLLENVDIIYGGLGRGAKFPQPMVQELLWRAYCRTGHSSFRKAVILTVEQICLGGIYDHLGGGFARYAVDERWLVPHFEKMLYDNALLIKLLTSLSLATGIPLFAQRVEETVAWALREMVTGEGAFAANLAADSEGYGTTEAGEGAFYIWDAEDIDAVLGEDSPLFKSTYDVDEMGNWEGVTVLNRLDEPVGKDPALEERLAPMRQKLWLEREMRPKPDRDDKVLTDWNALMVGALAHAGRSFDRPEWIDAATRAFAFVQDALGDGDRLYHSYREGRTAAAAILDDYANMAEAALCLFEVTGDIRFLTKATEWTAVVDRHFWDVEDGGYFLTPDDAEDVVLRSKSALETAVPSGNATMVGVLARLYAMTGEDRYRERAARAIAAFSGQVPNDFIAMAALVNNSESLHDLVQVVIVGEPDSEETARLLRSACETPLLDRLVVQVPPHAVLPNGHPAAGKTQVDGKAAAYICRGGACQLPITDPETLRRSFE